MARSPIVEYAGIALGGGTGYDWELTSGSAPAVRQFNVSKTRVAAIEQRLGSSNTLRITGPRKTMRAERVYLLEVLAGDDQGTSKIRLADRRWLWPKRWVSASFNIRRANGNKFLVGEGQIENRLIQPEIEYARWSLRGAENGGDGTTVWTAREILEHVLTNLLDTPTRWIDTPPQVPVQDLVLDHPGNQAVDKVLGYLPSVSLYIDLDGTAVLYRTDSGRERGAFDRAPASHSAGGWAEVVDKRALRPSKVVVLFTPEIEMRIDHTEPSDGGQSSISPTTEDEPTAYQVAPIPDVTLTVNGEELARSSIADLSDLFAAWGAFGLYDQQISFDALRKHALKNGWANFEQAWGNAPAVPPDAVKSARAATAASAWRRLFRLDRYWVQRIASIRPYRVSIVNFETGAYAPAQVYSDWIRRPSYKGFAATGAANEAQGWAHRGYNARLEDGRVAPARVNVLDEQIGLFEIVPQLDPFGLSQAMALGYPESGNMPSQILGEANRLGQELWARWDRVVLEAGWQMSVLLTVVPASPNSTARLHAVEVTPNEIENPPGRCVGPPVYTRVFPGVMTARFAWDDDRADEIKSSIKGETAMPSDLLLNDDFVRDVARAAASRIYEPLRDRVQGSMTIDMNPELAPIGTMSRVRHSMQGGITATDLSFPAAQQPLDVWQYLNSSTQAAILRVLNQPTTTGGA